MSDTYELAKANQDQSISAETPYGEKQFNFINWCISKLTTIFSAI